jgi:hypothetical protein
MGSGVATTTFVGVEVTSGAVAVTVLQGGRAPSYKRERVHKTVRAPPRS